VQAVEFAVPFIPAVNGSIDRLSLEVTAAGTAGALIRLGLRADSTTTPVTPGALLADFGTVSGTATGRQESAVLGAPVAVTAGTVYWLTATCQGAPTTAPTARANTGSNPRIVGSATSVGAGLVGYQQSGVAGALAAWAGLTASVSVPWVWARAV